MRSCDKDLHPHVGTHKLEAKQHATTKPKRKEKPKVGLFPQTEKQKQTLKVRHDMENRKFELLSVLVRCELEKDCTSHHS